MGDNMITLA